MQLQSTQLMQLTIENNYEEAYNINNDPLIANDISEDEVMSFKRENKNIVGYMCIEPNKKAILLSDGTPNPRPEKALYIGQGILGTGMYFYEYNFRFAKEVAKAKNLDIIGAIISVNNVLDFTDYTAQSIYNKLSKEFLDYINNKKTELLDYVSGNKNKQSKTYIEKKDELQRLNNNIINIDDFYTFCNLYNKENKMRAYDSVRAIASEGMGIFGFCWFQSTVLCIKNKYQIKEYFNPERKENNEYIYKKYFDTKKK